MATERETAKDYVLKSARDNDVKFIRLWFSDILGNLKGVVITIEELPDALDNGVGFDGSSIQGFARTNESDMVAMPDLNTFSILPWRPRENAVARLFCDILKPDGKPFEGDPRFVLKRNVENATKKGFTYYVGPELEYFYFKNQQSTEFLDQGGYFDQMPMDVASDLRRETVLTLSEMGIPVKASHHEVAPSQHEIDLQHTDAVAMADNVMTAKHVIKEIAVRHNIYASFMPKPIYGVHGSGMHVHQSLFKGNTNAFFDDKEDSKLSDTAKSYIAGLIKHAPSFTLVTNQWVNSYKRLEPGFEAPIYISWAKADRSDLIRVPAYKKGRADSVRIEYRAPDPACNPYLAFAVMLSAGLDGVEKNLTAPAPLEDNREFPPHKDTDWQGVSTLPGSLWEALLLTKEDDFVRETLGDHLFENFIQNKKMEWNEYKAQVTDYELNRYLHIL